MEEFSKIVFCKNRKCEHVECLRHNINAPYNVVITRKDFDIKKGECEGYIV